MPRFLRLVVAGLTCVRLAGCVSQRQFDEAGEVGTDLATASTTFYDDHGRWPRELNELEGFDSTRLRSVHFHKRPIDGGLDIRYTTRAASREGPSISLYLPPPRSWSPKGVRTLPATAPTTAEGNTK